MFSEPRHRRRTVVVAAVLLALLIGLPLALRRPEASSATVSAVSPSADALEAHSASQAVIDRDPWAGLPEAIEQHEEKVRKFLEGVAAEEARVAAEKAAAHEQWHREQDAKKAAAAQAAAQAAAKPAAPAASSSYSGDVWDDLAQCESHGNWSINTGNGYYGGLQMDTQFWDTYGNPAYGQANEASRSEQIAAATKARDSGRGYHPWPTCARKLGLI